MLQGNRGGGGSDLLIYCRMLGHSVFYCEICGCNEVVMASLVISSFKGFLLWKTWIDLLWRRSGRMMSRCRRSVMAGREAIGFGMCFRNSGDRAEVHST